MMVRVRSAIRVSSFSNDGVLTLGPVSRTNSQLMIEIAMDMRQYDCPFIDTTDDHGIVFGSSHWEFDTVAEQLETRMVVEAADRAALDDGLTTLREHRQMHDFDLIAKQEGHAKIRTVINQTDAMETIRRNDGYITGPFHIEDGTETWHVGFDTSGKADGALSELERDNEFTVADRRDLSLPEMTDLIQHAGAAMTLIDGCRELSETERATLEAAAEHGYFDTPRETDLGGLADEFGISKPAASKNLRRAQRKMFDRIVDTFGELD